LPVVERLGTARPLRYRVIDGTHIARSFPGIGAIAERVQRVVAAIAPSESFFLDNLAARVNVNIVAPGGSYRWHYDRNAFTGLVSLNAVLDGEIEMYPNYRFRLGSGTSWLQRLADGVAVNATLRDRVSKKHVIRPEPGLLIVIRGDRCLHSVAPVAGETDRVSLVIAFDRPGKIFGQQDDLDRYLYSTQTSAGQIDPNYTS
jgi:hypothetical protein